MSHRILAAGLLAVTVSLASVDTADAGTGRWEVYQRPTTYYVIEVQWWRFDWDYTYWQTVQTFTNQEEALQSLMFHEWALANGYIDDLYDPGHPYLFPIDVRVRIVKPWTYQAYGG